MTLAEDAARFLHLIWNEGEVRELRVLKHNRWGHTASGYFETPEQLIPAAERFDGTANIFFTFNPVNPALLARANNRIVEKAAHATADDDVVRRRWILVDCDAVRPSGISSTDAELAETRDLALRVATWLAEQGYPELITSMSGNGHSVLVPVDLPNDTESTRLVEAFLSVLAQRFDTPDAHIDPTVSNASRIMGLVGTVKVKGDDMPDRPHRRSHLVSVPGGPLEPVTREQLVAVAGLATLRSEDRTPLSTPASGSLANLLTERGVSFREHVRRDVTWYDFESCPWQPAGTPFKCGLGQRLPDGPFLANCFHPAGKGKRWRDWAPLLGIEAPPAPSAVGLDRYEATDDGITWFKPTREGEVPYLLTNWTARIVVDIVEDDGIEQTRVLEIEAAFQGGTKRFTVPFQHFASLNWAAEHLGAEAIIRPGSNIRQHAEVAIRLCSGSAERRTVYKHTGWRIIGGQPAFLHAAGGLTAEGPLEDVSVGLRDTLARFALPGGSSLAEVEAGVRASLGLFDLGPLRLMAPLLGATYLAVLRELLDVPPDFVYFLHGPSGTFKSEIAALLQGHYGSFTRTSFVATFASTGNALERIMSALKDVLVVVDDFHPANDRFSEQAMNQTVARLLRSVGNNAGRARMRYDTSLRPEMHPRGVVLATGERLPQGHSTSARMLPVPIEPGSVTKDRLSSAQATANVFPHAMAAFIRWVAGRFISLKETLPERFRELRTEASRAVEGHAREPGQVAHTFLALETFLAFVVDTGLLARAEADVRLDAAWCALLDLSREQSQALAADAPVERFRELLVGGFSSKAIYLEARNGEAPADAEDWGWETVYGGRDEDGNERRYERRPAKGTLIGRLDDDWLLLFPKPTYQYIVAAAQRGNSEFGHDERSLHRRLAEAGSIEIAVESGTVHRTVNVRISGRTQRVLKLRRSFVDGDADDPVPLRRSTSASANGNGIAANANLAEAKVPTVPHVPRPGEEREVTEI